MKFSLICQDTNFTASPGFINGGTVTFWHLWHTLESIGHEATLHELGVPIPDADVYFIQSEWYEKHKEELETKRQQGKKLVVWLGHFKGGVYFDPTKIEADIFYTTWAGPVVDSFEEKTGKQVLFLPHAYCTFCDSGDTVDAPKLPWVGNDYALRDDGWLKGLDIVSYKGIHPKKLSDLYRSATVCPNIHGDFQKGIVSDDPSSIADEPGLALNERFFQILGAGGFMVCDFNPQISEFFDLEEMVIGSSKEEFQAKIRHFIKNPKQRYKYIKNWVKKIREAHTYEHRLAKIIESL